MSEVQTRGRQYGPNVWGMGVRLVRWLRARRAPRAAVFIAPGLILLMIMVIAGLGALIEAGSASDAKNARERHLVNTEKCEVRGGHVVIYADNDAQCLRDGAVVDLVNGDGIDSWWTGVES
jgi:hypothetical protein